MPRKPKDDTPPGGWDSPGTDMLDTPALRYADHTKDGKWVWKPIDAKYHKWREEQLAMVGLGPKSQVRVRTRTRRT